LGCRAIRPFESVYRLMHEVTIKPTGEITAHRIVVPATVEVPAE
jgi:hypothetical protein